jgi:hypothetical protein
VNERAGRCAAASGGWAEIGGGKGPFPTTGSVARDVDRHAPASEANMTAPAMPAMAVRR